MALTIPINTTIEVPSTTQMGITQGVVNFLHLDLDNTLAYMKISYLDATNAVVSTRYFKVSGNKYLGLIGQQVNGILANIVIGMTASFAMQILADLSLIDGIEVREMKKNEFMQEFMTKVI